MSRYENYSIKNNVHGSLYAPISSLATTIQLKDGEGARFSTDMLATLESVDTTGKVTKREIVLITGISGDVLTVTRKYAPCPASDEANTQSQISFSFDTSDTISVYITAEHFDNIKSGILNAEGELDDLNYDGNSRMKVIPAISGTALKIDIVAGVYRCGGDTIQFAGQTDISVTNNATNYIMVDGAGTVQISTSAWDTRYTRLATVICSGGAITSISDWRSDVVGGTLGGLEIHSLTEKVSPVNADELVLADSETSYTNKRVKIGNIEFAPFFSRVGNSSFGTGGFSSDLDHSFWKYSGTGYLGNLRGTYNKTASFNELYGTGYYKGYRYFIANTNNLYRCDETLDIADSNNWEPVINGVQSYSQITGMTDDYIYLNFGANIYKYDYNGNLITTITISQEPATIQLGTNYFWAGYTSSPVQGLAKIDMSGNIVETYNLTYGWYLVVKKGILFVWFSSTQTYYPICYA